MSRPPAFFRQVDSAFWGYRRNQNGAYEPISEDAFVLHLVGGDGNDADSIVPASLKRVVVIHRKLWVTDCAGIHFNKTERLLIILQELP